MLVFFVLVTTNTTLRGLAANRGTGEEMVESFVLVVENADVLFEK
jgi:hypothetical protein